MTKFQFITTTDNPKAISHDARVRRKIRRVAATGTKSKHDVPSPDEPDLYKPTSSDTSQHGGMHRFRLGSTKNVARKTRAERKTSLKNVSFWDPVIDPLGGDAWSLLHYYRYLFRSKSWAITAKADWFAFIIEDRAATHATLAFVALNQDLETSVEVSKRALHHRASALTQVRKGLVVGNQSPSDGLLGAIALLAVTEGLEGNHFISNAHVEALAKLIALRGGYQKLLNNQPLCRLIAWADLCNSTTFAASTRLVPIPDTPPLKSETDPDSLPTHKSSAFLASCRDELPQEAIQLVRLLNALPSHYPSDETTSSERQISSGLIQRLNQHVLQYRTQYIESPQGSEDIWLNLLWRSAFLYISLVLRQMPRLSEVVVERVSMVQAALAKITNSVERNDSPKGRVHTTVLLWARVIYFCALTSEKRVNSIVQGLQTTMTALSIRNLNELKDSLGEISWIRSFCEDELAVV